MERVTLNCYQKMRRGSQLLGKYIEKNQNYPSICCTSLSLRVVGGLEPIPADIEVRGSDTQWTGHLSIIEQSLN